MQRLKAGETPEQIVADRKLNVCIEGVKQIQAKLEKKTAKSKATTTKRDPKKEATISVISTICMTNNMIFKR